MLRRISMTITAVALAMATTFSLAPQAHATTCGQLLEEPCSIVFGVVCKVTGRCPR